MGVITPATPLPEAHPGGFSFMNLPTRQSRNFDKPAISIADQIQLLKNRGLLIHDSEAAHQILTYIGYYHLSAYELPFQKADHSSEHHLFNPGTTFEEILETYTLDRRLRLLIMDAIERIEIAIRAVIINEMSIPYGPHWYMDSSYFKPEFNHNNLILKIQDDIGHGRDAIQIRDICIRHYYETYATPSMPPIWMVFESLSFGKISTIFKNLNHADKKRIAKKFDLPVKVLTSWLHSIAYTRNLCAHHQRVWNRVFTIKPLIPNEFPIIAEEMKINTKFYAQAVILHVMMQIISPDSKWTDKLKSLLQEHQSINKKSMGFPEGWEEKSFWR